MWIVILLYENIQFGCNRFEILDSVLSQTEEFNVCCATMKLFSVGLAFSFHEPYHKYQVSNQMKIKSVSYMKE
jgi:hypothetical protein